MNVLYDRLLRFSDSPSAISYLTAAVRRCLVVLGLVAMTACSSGNEPSQSGLIDVRFNVTDVNGGPIAGADVVLSSTNARHMRFTDANGSTTFENLAPGDWNISTSAAGFETMTLDARFEAFPHSQSWVLSLDAVGAWAVGRAIVLGTRMIDLEDDGSTMTFQADIAVIDRNYEGIESLTSADFSLVSIDCGWGGPRDCASDAEGNATGSGGWFRPDGDVQFFGVQPPSDRHPYLVGVLVERSSATDDWDDRGRALKTFFTALGGNDVASLASIETVDGSARLSVHGPFTNDGSIYFDAIDQLGEPAGSRPELLEGLMEAIELAAAADGLGVVEVERSVLMVLAHTSISSVEAVDAASELARDLGVHVSAIHYDDFGYPEMAVRTGGFAVDVDDSRQLGMIFGALDRILAGTLPYYSMQFRVAGDPHTFVSGGNAKASLHIQVPTPFPSRSIFTRLDVAIL